MFEKLKTLPTKKRKIQAHEALKAGQISPGEFWSLTNDHSVPIAYQQFDVFDITKNPPVFLELVTGLELLYDRYKPSFIYAKNFFETRYAFSTLVKKFRFAPQQFDCLQYQGTPIRIIRKV